MRLTKSCSTKSFVRKGETRLEVAPHTPHARPRVVPVPMSPVLRPYQIAALGRARDARMGGARRVLITAPTGSGKSVLACEMIRTQVTSHGARVLVVAHRKELIDQFYVNLSRVGLVPGILRGQDERTDPSAPVQVGTIQTLLRRELPPAHIVFIDEAHRVPGKSYAHVLERYPKATVFGLTATPCRIDCKPLMEHFDALVQSASYSELIDAGAIVAPIVYAPRKPPDISKVHTIGGDYHEGELEAAMMQAHVVGDVVNTWMQRSEGRKTVLFAVSIAHSKELAANFAAEGVKVAHLDGTTPDMEREQILVDLEFGKLQMVCNVGVLVEGWDQPSVKCLVMARPTKSLTLWMQCAGRILRPWGTQPPVILDHSGNVDRHGLPHEDREWSLDGKAQRTSATKYRTCPACYAYVSKNPCPVCGHELVAKSRAPVKTAPGVLERIDAAIKKENEDPKRVFFDKQCELARRKGFKPGYAAAKYKEAFGDHWPPWSWSQKAKADFAADPEWQARVAKRTRDREFWKKQDEANAEAPGGEAHPWAPEPEGAFDGMELENDAAEPMAEFGAIVENDQIPF